LSLGQATRGCAEHTQLNDDETLPIINKNQSTQNKTGGGIQGTK